MWTVLKLEPPVRAAVERKTRCHPFPSLIPGSGTCGPNNIEHNWMCQLPSVVPGLHMWRQLTYPSILPWHPPSSADIFQNPAVPSYHFSGSPAPFHPASRPASCQSALFPLDQREGVGTFFRVTGALKLPRELSHSGN